MNSIKSSPTSIAVFQYIRLGKEYIFDPEFDCIMTVDEFLSFTEQDSPDNGTAEVLIDDRETNIVIANWSHHLIKNDNVVVSKRQLKLFEKDSAPNIKILWYNK